MIRMRKNTSNLFFFFFVLLLNLFLSLFHSIPISANTLPNGNSRETLEIIIGTTPTADNPAGSYYDPGCNCYLPPPPPPPPEECPEPPPPPPPPEPECPPPPPPPPPPEPECPPPSPPPPPPPSPPPPSPPPPSPPPPSPPPPPPPSPPPPPPQTTPELLSAIQSIKRFRARIPNGCDPFGVTKTWNGNGLCTDKKSYKGFFCDKIKGDDRFHIYGVKFNLFNLCGNLTAEDFLETFPLLVFFHINSNNFTGKIPSAISKQPYLYELDLSNNKYTGPFPPAIFAAKNLTILDIRYNMFTGPVPPRVFTIQLDLLFLNNNQFTGTIPDNLGSTPALFLTLANNKFYGNFPKSIGQANNTLKEAVILNNQLTGCLPYEIGLLKKSTIFDISINKFTGPIPHSFGCLTKMQRLNISSNNLSGAVPESVCKLKNLIELSLQNNYFTQVGPACRKLIKRGVLKVGTNCILDLPGQRTALECEKFFSKAKECPDHESMNYVPCNLSESEKYTVEEDLEAAAIVPAPSPAYAALESNGW
ncbi:uncharacterized protein At4g06744-like [Impatiens glandulifera]|uniref:uncharacterized protein At4g06744-like n=1 Tax=Impatiens glandulifera TaxID=253017 RepID=UPI001FB11F3B|nr:uncharacterized protein At4g06744-like [Impatiens glandulifera]